MIGLSAIHQRDHGEVILLLHMPDASDMCRLPIMLVLPCMQGMRIFPLRKNYNNLKEPIVKYVYRFLIIVLILSISCVAMAKQKYEIETSINDEKFIINGELFEAKTYCFDMEEGDMAGFFAGHANGACASAK